MAHSNSGTLVALNKIIDGDEVTYLGKRTSEFHISMTSRFRADRPPVVIYPRPESQYQADSDVETIETASVTSSEKDEVTFPEEYRISGLVWATPGLRNTCNIDSFLSGWVRRVRQTHGRAVDLIVTTDIPGNALIEIADYAMTSGEEVDAKVVKMLWYNAALEPTNERPALLRPIVDCVGANLCSVFQHLKHHSSYAVESFCQCGTVFHRDFFFEVHQPEQLGYLSDSKDYHKLRTPKCLRCSQKRQVVDLRPDPNNWLLPVCYNGTGDNKNPVLSRIPKFLRLGGIDLKLGYVSYCQTVPGLPRLMHEVSLQNIRGEWYLYDGLLTPRFKRWTQPKYQENNARMSTLVYFKLVDGNDTD